MCIYMIEKEVEKRIVIGYNLYNLSSNKVTIIIEFERNTINEKGQIR